MAMVGMPPLSGFVGKIAILDGLRATDAGATAWAVILGGSLLLLVGYARAGSTLFWKAAAGGGGAAAVVRAAPVGPVPLAVVFLLLASTGALSVLGGPVMEATGATAAELLDRDRYIRAVLPNASPKAP
jgi:multicomponent K+:H+ antiporter subunit D